jgi:hypothetical protein
MMANTRPAANDRVRRIALTGGLRGRRFALLDQSIFLSKQIRERLAETMLMRS